ncbi:MAG: DUF72 domain-containing protein [Thermodesulfovibrionales bacterium]|nr:DUF72 domain-containing protein [Thermodesulfovibrionales bacterium]
MIKVGCCGFPVSRKRYFESFKVVELQETFYQMPEPALAEKWRRDAPEDFEFTLKAWQLITHEPKSPTYRRLKIEIPEKKKQYYGSFKPTDEVMTAWQKTLEIAKILKAEVIVFQCPASFIPSEENKNNMKRFFKNIISTNFILAWEPRGQWSSNEIKTICEELNLVHTVDPFRERSLYGNITYYRLHGIEGLRYKYTEQDLKRLYTLCSEDKTYYVMFNNINMFEDALRFKYIAEGIWGIESLP